MGAVTLRNVMESNDRATSPPDGGLPDLLTGNPAFLLSWVARSAERRFHRTVEEHGLTPHQLGVLSALRGGPLVQSRISERLDIFKPAMVAIVNQLEAKGLVERRPHPSDRRALEVHLLPAADGLLDAVDADLADLADELFAPLSADERAVMHAALRRIAAAQAGASASTTAGRSAAPSTPAPSRTEESR
jgi:MarR family transcriptional regulator, lower aerobic nicotinate degradation pathway regulator